MVFSTDPFSVYFVSSVIILFIRFNANKHNFSVSQMDTFTHTQPRTGFMPPSTGYTKPYSARPMPIHAFSDRFNAVHAIVVDAFSHVFSLLLFGKYFKIKSCVICIYEAYTYTPLCRGFLFHLISCNCSIS